jgi:hypothetical protein
MECNVVELGYMKPRRDILEQDEVLAKDMFGGGSRTLVARVGGDQNRHDVSGDRHVALLALRAHARRGAQNEGDNDKHRCRTVIRSLVIHSTAFRFSLAHTARPALLVVADLEFSVEHHHPLAWHKHPGVHGS